MDVTAEQLLDWLLENLDKAAIASLFDSVDLANDRTIQRLEHDASMMPFIDEIIGEPLSYMLPEKVGIMISSYIEKDSGIEIYTATRNELDGSPQARGDTEMQACASLLRAEFAKEQESEE
jgi:hypothetical protein